MKKLIYFLLILILSSCINKDKKSTETISQRFNFKDVIEKIQQFKILQDTSIKKFMLWDLRGPAMLALVTNRFSDNGELFIYTKNYNNKKIKFYLYEKDTKPDVLDYITKLGDSLINTFNTCNLLNLEVLNSADISDSLTIIYTTKYFDSTLSQIKSVDSSFYDYELYIHDNPHYLYTLIYKVNDKIDSKEFIKIKQKHTIRKIRPNWYYYRSYEISDRFKMDYFLNKE